MKDMDLMKQHALPRLFVFVSILILSATSTSAAEIKSDDLVPAVETWVRQVTADARPTAEIVQIDPYIVDGQTVAYIVQLDDGYCICGADDRLCPIYLYRPTGAYDPENPNYQDILDEIATRLHKIEIATAQRDPILNQYRTLLDERAALWNDLKARRAPAPRGETDDRSDPTNMRLPLTSYWKQGSPFNDYCPELTPGADEHTVVGCVATAMAQIMYFWQWPAAGNGTASGTYHYRYHVPSWLVVPLANDPNLPASWIGRLEWHSGELRMTGYWDESLYESAQNVSTNSAYLSALADLWGLMTSGSTSYSVNLGAATYNWSSMRDEATDPPSAGDLEAAEISYHAGVVLGMDYGVKGSSASTDFTPWIYNTRFDFDPDAYYTGFNESLIIENIRWFRLVQIRGETEDGGGHSWIIAGYNTNVSPTQYLMNMGWGGGTTEWYTRDAMFPYDQGQVLNIAPESVVRFAGGGGIFADGSPDNPFSNLEYAIAIVPDDTTLVLKAGTTHTLSGSPVVLDKPMTLKGYDVRIERD